MPPRPQQRLPRYDPARDVSRLRRLMWMVAGLIVVWYAAMRPANWKWLTDLNHGAASQGPGSSSAGGANKAPEGPLDEGVVRIVESATDSPLPPADAAKLQKVAGHVIEIPPALLKTIRHDYDGLRASESAALDVFLDRVRSVPLSVLEQASSTEFSYAELDNDPERYAGRISRFAAEVRRCNPLSLKTDTGEQRAVYEAWVFTESGGRKNPYRVLCDQLPEGFPTGDAVRVKVGVTGYFFKRFGYQTNHGPHSAPMFVVKRFRWSKPIAGTTSETTWAGRSTGTFFALLAGGFVFVVWRLSRHERQQEQLRRDFRKQQTPEAQLDPDNLPREQQVEEFLQKLSSSYAAAASTAPPVEGLPAADTSSEVIPDSESTAPAALPASREDLAPTDASVPAPPPTA